MSNPDSSHRPWCDAPLYWAQGVLAETLDITKAVVALADMAVTRGVSLVEMARDIVADEVDPGSGVPVQRETEVRSVDPSNE